MRSLLLGSGIALALCGCLGPVSYTGEGLAPESQTVRKWQQVDVIHLNQIKRDYEIVGECRGDAWLDNVVSLKKQAARLGADAISIPKPDGTGRIISYAIRYK